MDLMIVGNNHNFENTHNNLLLKTQNYDGIGGDDGMSQFDKNTTQFDRNTTQMDRDLETQMNINGDSRSKLFPEVSTEPLVMADMNKWEPYKIKALETFELAKRYYKISGPMLPGKRDNLVDEEIEMKKPNRYRQVKYVAGFVFGLYIIIAVLTPTLGKIGSHISKITSMERHQTMSFNLNSNGGLGQLLPVHHFAFFDKYEMIDRVECLKNSHQQACMRLATSHC